MTLSTPVKVIALGGLALILGAAAVLVLMGQHSTPGATASPANTARPVTFVQVKASTHPATHHAKPKPALRLDPGLPAAVRAKLERSREVVALVYTGQSVSDRAELAEVRAGAHTAHVPFVALDVADEQVADAVYGWTSSSADPDVLIVTQPGKIAFDLAGLTDRQTIAQAAAGVR